MSLKYALLGFLNYQSMTGYQLKKYFDQSIGNFWNASLSQIYPTLNQMYEEGLLDVEFIQQDLLPNAKKYTITSLGKEELINWLNGDFKRDTFRSEMLVRLFFSSNISKEQVVTQLEELLQASQEKILIYKEQEKHIVENHFLAEDMADEAIFWSLTADYGIMQEDFISTWCKACIQKIETSKGIKKGLDEKRNSDGGRKN